MTVKSFFLKDIDNDDYIATLNEDEKLDLNDYLNEMFSGPGTSDLDMEWSENGRGYYRHDHILYEIIDLKEKADYLENLKEDIDEWLIRFPNHYVIEHVKEIITDYKVAA